MHSEDFRKDNCGVVSGLRDGGYSDDMTLAAIAGISLEFTLCDNQCFSWSLKLHVYCHDFVPFRGSQQAH